MRQRHQDTDDPGPKPAAVTSHGWEEEVDAAPRRTLLAVVGDEGPHRGVLDRGRALAAGARTALRVAVLHQRLGLSTDPALAAYVGRRLAARLRVLQAELGGVLGLGQAVSVDVLEYGRPPRPCGRRTAWRAVDAFAGAIGAGLVIAPWELSEVAWSRTGTGGRVLLAVPDDLEGPPGLRGS